MDYIIGVLMKSTPKPKMTGEEIVISGISGIFPNTDNTRDLIKNLYNKVDMVKESTETSVKHAELPKHFGRLNGLEKFDAQFFRVTHIQADSYDPVGRKILEQAYSAIFDAGINPETLKGTNLGVFIGSSQADNATLNLYDVFKKNGFVITGCSKSMLANRISYWIDGKGPSFGLDYACASSIACLELAFQRLKSGECEAALVGGCNHSFHPVFSINMKRAGLICLDGKTKCFDKNGDGYVRSDAINILFLQKSKDAKRIYTEVINIKEKFITKPDSLFLPTRNPEDLAELMEELYLETDFTPDDVEYVEANATGIAEADDNEVNAIAKVFSKNKPIKVGSVKSNMGNTQAVSGACSLTKICLSYQKGEIPANIHLKEPLTQITKEGKVQVVTENTKFGRGLIALNNFSTTGANYHVLLKGHFKPKQLDLYKTTIPRLVLASGRQDKSVYKIFDIIENKPIDVEELALLNNIFKYYIPGHTGRGYTILEPKDGRTRCVGRGFEYYSGTTRPIWFLYSGMGSQWAGMGSKLMQIPIFAAAIERCNKVLLPRGINIHKIITDNDSDVVDNILYSFVGITAVQIGLTDILKSVGLKPNNIIGHSAGEIACAYADECLSAEECILLSYYRGFVSLQTELIKGKMAAIGLGHKEVRDLCPPEIDIACKNSATSTTISGPANVVESFVADLRSRFIFAKVVASSNIAFHSRYIADAGPKLLAELEKVLKSPKKRSQKWLSTCFLPEQWNDSRSKNASPEYFTYNLLNTVHFEEVANMIPANAIVIEVAPHGLMQAIVKRSHPSCLNIALAKRGNEDNILILLNALGTLFQAGLNVNVDALYPKMDFPVSTETPVISHFVDWEHSKDWSINNFDLIKKNKMVAKEFDVSVHDDEYAFIKEYARNGITLFPESAILIKVWETVAMYKETTCENLPIIFNNVNFHDEITVQSEEILRLRVRVQPGSNLFEVTCDDKLITSGSVKSEFEDIDIYEAIPCKTIDNNINATDIYKLLNMRGYHYEGRFQSIQSANLERDLAILKWENDWTYFLDALFQMSALSRDYDGMSAVKLINKLAINPRDHKNRMSIKNNGIYYGAQIFKDLDICKSGGVVLKSVVFKDVPILEQTDNKLQIRKPIQNSSGFEDDVCIQPAALKDDICEFENVKLVNNGNKHFWTEIPMKSDAVKVAYAGISLSNNSSNKINKFGTDFSGITANGQRVMGIVSDKAITRFVEANLEFLWPVPQFWSMEEAATVPIPYIQAYYVLTIRKSLRRGDTVLITNGDSGFGQAVISICMDFDCRIFTTVKNIKRKNLLMRVFPGLDANHIGCSCEDSFLHMVRNATNGNGCDFVINDNTGMLRQAAIGCMGHYSTLLDLCELGMKRNDIFGMACLTCNRNIKSVCLANIFLKENYEERKLLQSLVIDGIKKGVVRPLARIVYTPANISRASQVLSNDSYSGRVLINMKDLDISKSRYNLLPRVQLNSRNLYIVVCDGSELSVELIDHLIRGGARQFLLHLKPQMMNGYFRVKHASWKKCKVVIHFNTEDLIKKSDFEKFIRLGMKLGCVGGIFVCQNEAEEPNYVNKKNYDIVSSLDLASRKIDTLRYFAVLALTIRGITNNSEFSNIEKCCFARNKIGLPALALRHAMNEKNITRPSLSRLFNALDSSLRQNFTSVLSSDKIEEPVIETKPVSGFKAFFPQFDIDEYSANDPMIIMKTQLNNQNESELYMDSDEDHLLIVPGFDGLYSGMVSVSERLKILAVTMQLEPDYHGSIDQIASRLVELVKIRFHLKSKFYLLGYSFGVNVALKTAALLEKEGRSGIVFCLDSSPEALKVQLSSYLGDMTDVQLQNSLIQHIYQLLTGETSTELKDKLEAVDDWPEKVNSFIGIAKRSVSYTHEYLRTFVHVAYRRIVLAKEYKPDFKLNSEVILIKGVPHPKSKLSDDYGLSKYTNKPVKVFNIQSDHATAPQDCRVSNIVNKMLDSKHLEEFKKKNLCQYYIYSNCNLDNVQ